MEQLLHSLVKFLQCADRLSAQSAEFRGIDPITVSEHFFPLLVCGHTHINAVILTFVCDEDRLTGRFCQLRNFSLLIPQSGGWSDLHSKHSLSIS